MSHCNLLLKLLVPQRSTAVIGCPSELATLQKFHCTTHLKGYKHCPCAAASQRNLWASFCVDKAPVPVAMHSQSPRIHHPPTQYRWCTKCPPQPPFLHPKSATKDCRLRVQCDTIQYHSTACTGHVPQLLLLLMNITEHHTDLLFGSIAHVNCIIGLTKRV
jgi:hypothetical protein